jgi:hypothetical protein
MFSSANSPAKETVEETVESVSVDMATSGLYFPMTIPEIHSFEWGTNNSPEGLDKGFTHLFFVTFKSESDREV